MPPTDPLLMLFLLAGGHALGDFALQSDWVATNKNRNIRLRMPIEERARTQVIWPWLLGAHSFHHGLIVFLITQRPAFGVAETICHVITDFGKCEKWFGFHADQVIHLVTKAAWAGLIYYGF